MLSKTLARLGLITSGGTVSLCHADASLNITHREGSSNEGGGSGWSAVASRGSWRKMGGASASGKGRVAAAAGAGGAGEQRVSSGFVALRRLEARKKAAAAAAAVEEDWLAAVEREEEKAEEVVGDGAATEEVEQVTGSGEDGVVEEELLDDAVPEARDTERGEGKEFEEMQAAVAAGGVDV